MFPKSGTLGLPRAPKARGEVAEARFIAKALSLGFCVSRPFGDSAPFDFIVQAPGGRLSRVQVKSAWQETVQRGYHFAAGSVHTAKGPVTPYRAEEVDFVVAYTAPEDAWFVIPIRELRGCTHFRLRFEAKTRLLEFRERWELMTQIPIQ